MKIDTTLYLVTDSTDKSEDEFLDILEKACKGGITLLQLREKKRSGRDFLALALKVKTITDKYNIPFIINDRIDVALASSASGVHVGQSDIPVQYARMLLGKDKIVGATAKTVDQALKAYKQGADYLGVGAIFPTTTKVVTQITDVSTLNEICNTVPIPAIAIGGLNINNIDILKDSSIAGISVVSAIMKAEDPKKAASDLKIKITQMLKK